MPTLEGQPQHTYESIVEMAKGLAARPKGFTRLPELADIG